MDTRPLLTSILPTFNAAAVLGGCLETLDVKKCQLEILLMDGASQDDTLAIAASFIQRLPGLRMLSEPDEGIYDAMNKGMDLATGEWLYFIGADDRWIDADRIADLLLKEDASTAILQINGRKGENESYTRIMSRSEC